MSENIMFFQVETTDGSLVDWVQIEHKPNEFISMTKAYWEQLEAQKQAQKKLGETL